MAERLGITTIRGAISTLLGNNTSDLNSGLATSVKQTINTARWGEPTIPTTMYPTVALEIGDSETTFRGASKRKEITGNIKVHVGVRVMSSLVDGKDEAAKLIDNIRYIIDTSPSIATNTVLEETSVAYDDNADTDGFIVHAVMNLQYTKVCN